MFGSRPTLEKPVKTKLRRQPEEIMEKQRQKRKQKQKEYHRKYDEWEDERNDHGC